MPGWFARAVCAPVLPTSFVLAAAWCLPVAHAQPPQAPRAVDASRVVEPAVVPPLDVAEMAGLAKGSKPPVLTWERAYTLALLRSRAGRDAPLARKLDTEAVDRDFQRLVAGDFDGFRKAFLSTDGSFRDPAPDLLDLAHRLGALDNARRSIAGREALRSALRDVIKGESTSLSQLDLDVVDSQVQEARAAFVVERERFQNRLDEVKTALGLAPDAAIVPDATLLEPFRKVFEAADAWERNPSRELMELPRLALALPVLGDVTLGGHSLREHVLAPEPLSLEPILEAAVGAAAEGRKVAAEALDPGLATRVRRRVRALGRGITAQELELRRFVLDLRLKDQAFERLIAPPTTQPSAGRSRSTTTELLSAQDQVVAVENRLVGFWTGYQAERLALHRDLGALPDADWPTFRSRLTPTARKPEPRRPALPNAPVTAPATVPAPPPALPAARRP